MYSGCYLHEYFSTGMIAVLSVYLALFSCSCGTRLKGNQRTEDQNRVMWGMSRSLDKLDKHLSDILKILKSASHSRECPEFHSEAVKHFCVLLEGYQRAIRRFKKLSLRPNIILGEDDCKGIQAANLAFIDAFHSYLEVYSKSSRKHKTHGLVSVWMPCICKVLPGVEERSIYLLTALESLDFYFTHFTSRYANIYNWVCTGSYYDNSAIDLTYYQFFLHLDGVFQALRYAIGGSDDPGSAYKHAGGLAVTIDLIEE